ncbi:hypothetical protein J3E69DRAFT_321109, partial [Trichoderma sp. SZMC 28015]
QQLRGRRLFVCVLLVRLEAFDFLCDLRLFFFSLYLSWRQPNPHLLGSHPPVRREDGGERMGKNSNMITSSFWAWALFSKYDVIIE